MGIFRKKQEPAPSKEYGAWCELVTLLSRSELENLAIIESRWKEAGNKTSGRFNLQHYLLIVQHRRNESRSLQIN